MKTDIEIAQEAVMQPIKEVAANYGIGEDDLELYGKYKAKLTDDLYFIPVFTGSFLQNIYIQPKHSLHFMFPHNTGIFYWVFIIISANCFLHKTILFI